MLSNWRKEGTPPGGFHITARWSKERQDYICDKIFWQIGKGRRHYLARMPLKNGNLLRPGDSIPDEFYTATPDFY